jgi:hypothetical protein
MKIPVPASVSPIEEIAAELKNCKNEDIRKTVTCEIDREVYKLYGLSSKQIEIVEGDIYKEES